MPVPPDVRQQQGEGQPQQSLLSKFGSMQSDSQNASVRVMQELGQEISKVAESTMKIAQMADKALPSLMGDVAKMIEVGKSMKQAVMSAMQQMQQGSSTSPEQPVATSPTDAPEPAAA